MEGAGEEWKRPLLKGAASADCLEHIHWVSELDAPLYFCRACQGATSETSLKTGFSLNLV